MTDDQFKRKFLDTINNQDNPFHPLVWINGDPEIGENVSIGGFSELNANGARMVIGDNCDIASFTVINCADSHRFAIGLAAEVERRDIVLEHNVFVGAHSAILGGAYIGHHSVIGAGSIVRAVHIPPYSLAVGNPLVVKPGYYLEQAKAMERER